MKALYRRLLFLYREYGPLNLVLFLGIRPWQFFFRNAEYLFVILSDNLSENTEDRPEFEVKPYRAIEELSENDLEAWSLRKGGMEPLLAFLDAFFSRGAVLWTAHEQGAMVGYVWTARKGLLGFYFLPLLDSEAVMHAGEVFPEFRGRDVLPAMIEQVARRLSREGVEHSYLGCKVWNRAAYRAISKTSAIEIGRASEFRIGGRTIVVWKDVAGPRTKNVESAFVKPADTDEVMPPTIDSNINEVL